MTAFDSAAIVAAGTALVLAPIDPQPFRDPNPEPVTLSPLVILLAASQADLAVRVRVALGLPGHGQPRSELGETATCVHMWDQVDLNAVYERVGGTVTTRTVQRSTSGGEATWQATEITVTVDLPGIGAVEIVTDWCGASGGHDMPLMRAIPDAVLISG